MTLDRMTIESEPQQVWSALADGWLYPLWMVGATAVRHVDPSWPQPGSRIRHATGAWPLMLEDSTRVQSGEPERQLVLLVRRWPFGRARLTIGLTPHSGGTEVTLEEDALSGLGAWLPEALKAPVLHVRNTETLTRIGFVAKGRTKVSE